MFSRAKGAFSESYRAPEYCRVGTEFFSCRHIQNAPSVAGRAEHLVIAERFRLMFSQLVGFARKYRAVEQHPEAHPVDRRTLAAGSAVCRQELAPAGSHCRVVELFSCSVLQSIPDFFCGPEQMCLHRTSLQSKHSGDLGE